MSPDIATCLSGGQNRFGSWRQNPQWHRCMSSSMYSSGLSLRCFCSDRSLSIRNAASSFLFTASVFYSSMFSVFLWHLQAKHCLSESLCIFLCQYCCLFFKFSIIIVIQKKKKRFCFTFPRDTSLSIIYI